MEVKLFEEFVFEKEESASTYLLFNGNTLQFIEKGKVKKSWKAVSGRTYYHWFVNPSVWKKRYTIKPEEWAKSKSQGPTPPGLYKLGATQHRTSVDNKWKTDPDYVKSVVSVSTASMLPGSDIKDEGHEFAQNTKISKVAWGDWRWSLIPEKGTQTYGRGSFYLHGGSTPGSIGCVDLVTQSDDFAKYYQDWQKRTGNKTITLKIDYSTYDKNASIDVPSQPYKMPAGIESDVQKWYDVTDKEILASLNREKIKINSDTLKSRRS